MDAFSSSSGPGARLLKLAIMTLDALLIMAAMMVAYQLRAWLAWPVYDSGKGVPVPVGAAIIVAWIVLLFLWGSYRHGRLSTGPAEYSAVALASSTLLGVLAVIGYLFDLPMSQGFYVLLFLIGPP